MDAYEVTSHNLLHKIVVGKVMIIVVIFEFLLQVCRCIYFFKYMKEFQLIDHPFFKFVSYKRIL